MTDPLEQAAEAIRSARHLVVFTSAGVSAESGVPTFRDADGFWNRFPTEDFGNWRGIVRSARRQPRRLAEYVACVLGPIAESRPNTAHRAIAHAEGRIERLTIVTQNIDGLHQRAGSTTVFEIHGTLLAKRSLRGDRRGTLTHAQLLRTSRRVARARTAWPPLPRLLLALRPLLGIGWRGFYRPDVVLFGDPLAEPAWGLARRAVENCDCFLQIGTSGMVYPAALLPDEAQDAGAVTIAVDPNETLADLWLPGTACEVVPELFERAFGDDGRAEAAAPRI